MKEINFFTVEKLMDGIHMDKFNLETNYIALKKLMVVWIMEEVYLIMLHSGYGYQEWVFLEIIE